MSKIREDADQYCLLYLGILLLSAYYFHFFFQMSMGWLILDFLQFVWLALPPLLMVFFFIGYFKPDRSRVKINMLAIGGFVGVIYLIFFVRYGWSLADTSFYASWSIGAAVLVAGGFSMMASYEDSHTLGIMDVSKLSYGPPLEVPEPEPEEEIPSVEVTEAEATKEETESKETTVVPEETTE
ncbi:MAG: hypothetical protein P1Q69_10190 [Candidatus Thorarchaeota archaeon]|nr:hypothetical protein [Candidatus Thorarchaeota archaeon]